jgi:hypothetical protein
MPVVLSSEESGMHHIPQIPVHLRSPLGLLAGVILFGWAFLFPLDAAGMTLTIPSEACPGTLQECIDTAPDGATVELATDAPFDESLLVTKSLTLTSVPGIVGRIGNGGGEESRTISVRDDKAEGPISVTLHGLYLINASVDAKLGIYGPTAGGSRVTVTDCEVYLNIAHNNGAAVNVSTNVPATAVVSRNRINSTGQAIGFHTGMRDGAATLVAEANTISTDLPEFSNIGIQVDLQVKGSIHASVVNNVIRGVAGCYCGAASGIFVHVNGAVQATVDVVNNTLDRIDFGAPGISIRRPPAGDSTLTVNAFNNIVTRGTGSALVLPEATSQLVFNNDHNDFFANREPDHLGPHVLGPHTLSVDPLYVSDRDLRLRPESPLVDAGIGEVPGGLPAGDADGRPRVSGLRVDVGAYEREISAPTVAAIEPASGPPAGGTPVTIRGSGFFRGATVAIGAAPAAQVVVVDAATITAVTPPNAEGGADVVVTNPGALGGTLTGGFAYVEGARPIGGLELGLTPRRGAASLRLHARLEVADGHAFDPTADGVTLGFATPGGAPVVRTIPGARFVANRARNRFRFADPRGRTAGGVTKVVVQTAGGGVLLEARAKALPLAAASGAGIAVDVVSGTQRFAREATCAPSGRQLACR